MPQKSYGSDKSFFEDENMKQSSNTIKALRYIQKGVESFMHISWQQINQINLNTTTNSNSLIIWPKMHIFIKRNDVFRADTEPISSCLLNNRAIMLTACQVVLPALHFRDIERLSEQATSVSYKRFKNTHYISPEIRIDPGLLISGQINMSAHIPGSPF